ncbi:MAG TPA: ATP-binding protein [Methanotrichaceae archaeon]|nr:ATP-binding protein [Methanotrichaceae archaeon]
MTEPGCWEEENSRYLALSLERLRLLLEKLANDTAPGTAEQPMKEPPAEVSPPGKVAEEVPSSQPVVPDPPQKTSFFRRFLPLMVSAVISDFGAPQDTASHDPPRNDTCSDEALIRVEKAMAAAEAMEPPPALIILSRKLGLSRFESDLLFLCVATELDTRIPQLCASAQGDLCRPYPTFALAMALFDGAAWDSLSPDRPLRYWKLIEIDRTVELPLISSPLRVDERIISYVRGINYLDDRLASMLIPTRGLGSEICLPPSQRATVDEIHDSIETCHQHSPIIQLLGEDSSTKQMIARTASDDLGLHLYRLQVLMMPSHASDLEVLSKLWQRESILLPVALYIDASDADAASQTSSGLNLFLESSNGVIFLDVKERWRGISRDIISINVSKPTSLEQRYAWLSILGSAAGEAPSKLSGQFDLNLQTIDHIARTVLSRASEECEPLEEELWHACRYATRPRVEGLAQILDARATWEDIVLPDQQTAMLRQVADQMNVRSRVYDDWGFGDRMNRGMGISVLFIGESGTGKTMAAEVLANDLDLDLYRIDLSAVVSKYIGETEKNLRKVFDSMEGSGALLFFDEADALFGKRSEVKDSHDRYANIEVNYLLQRMESYRGLAILATNMKSALDRAFTRRLRFMVSFPFPGPVERRAIWAKALPKKVPVTDLDYDRLARLNLTGGSIHNIALNAAFLAAKAESPVSMSLVLESARSEFLKLEMPIKEADFIWPPEVRR